MKNRDQKSVNGRPCVGLGAEATFEILECFSVNPEWEYSGTAVKLAQED
jgi:hypothetical protein